VNVGTFAYFAIAIALCAAGFIAIFSVGAPLFLTGVVMLAASPWRERRGVLWPGIAAVWTFTVTYVLLAPLGCTGTTSPGRVVDSFTECTNVLGINYRGGTYDPPLLPALLAGLVAGAPAALLLRRLLKRRRVDA
jgi:membrane-bound ClpP family serine protease